ncbi:hypothetical protein RhiJN_09540 [Ceratobasidium sp. AG-Ba]|nr:hypothetical protein RhiJN_09540 [Ceratobasidium sp. AG-Ba]
MGAVLSRHKLWSCVRRFLKKPLYNSKHNASHSTLVEPAFLHESKISEKPLYFEPATQRIKEYSKCPEASRASCEFVDRGPLEVEAVDLMLYRRQVPGNDDDLVVGVGVRSRSSGEITPLVLIESDEYGIHFTGRLAHDPSQCFFACLRNSTQLHPVVRHIIYLDFLRNLQNRSATFIWDWWRSGADMDRIDRLIGQWQ